jgi:hypothetical protein
MLVRVMLTVVSSWPLADSDRDPPGSGPVGTLTRTNVTLSWIYVAPGPT